MKKYTRMILAVATGLFMLAGCNFAEEQEVIVSVRSVSLDCSNVEMTVGGSTVLYATVLPENATDKSFEFSSSADSVATVDANGVVTAVAAGTAIITAQSTETIEKDYENKKAICTVTVLDPAKADFISLKQVSEGVWSFDMIPSDMEIVIEYED
jgi:uncharacterized protein YjdB